MKAGSDREMGYIRDVGFPEDVIDALQESKESTRRNCCRRSARLAYCTGMGL